MVQQASEARFGHKDAGTSILMDNQVFTKGLQIRLDLGRIGSMLGITHTPDFVLIAAQTTRQLRFGYSRLAQGNIQRHLCGRLCGDSDPMNLTLNSLGRRGKRLALGHSRGDGFLQAVRGFQQPARQMPRIRGRFRKIRKPAQHESSLILRRHHGGRELRVPCSHVKNSQSMSDL